MSSLINVWCQYNMNQVHTSEEWPLAWFDFWCVQMSHGTRFSQTPHDWTLSNLTRRSSLVTTIGCGLIACRNNFIAWIAMMTLGLTSLWCAFGAFCDDIRYVIVYLVLWQYCWGSVHVRVWIMSLVKLTWLCRFAFL